MRIIQLTDSEHSALVDALHHVLGLGEPIDDYERRERAHLENIADTLAKTLPLTARSVAPEEWQPVPLPNDARHVAGFETGGFPVHLWYRPSKLSRYVITYGMQTTYHTRDDAPLALGASLMHAFECAGLLCD